MTSISEPLKTLPVSLINTLLKDFFTQEVYEDRDGNGVCYSANGIDLLANEEDNIETIIVNTPLWRAFIDIQDLENPHILHVRNNGTPVTVDAMVKESIMLYLSWHIQTKKVLVEQQ